MSGINASVQRLTPAGIRLADLAVAVVDHFHDTRQIMPTGVRSILISVEGALDLNEEDLSQRIFGYVRQVLEHEELTDIPSISAALHPASPATEEDTDGC